MWYRDLFLITRFIPQIPLDKYNVTPHPLSGTIKKRSPTLGSMCKFKVHISEDYRSDKMGRVDLP